jgi:tetratricopeptide (TPR) repeat protein
MMAKKALELDEDNMYALFILAKNEKDLDTRIERLIDVHKKWPEYVRNTNEVGISFGAKKNSEEAIVWYKKCLEIAPQNAQTYNNIGFRLSVLKQYK